MRLVANLRDENDNQIRTKGTSTPTTTNSSCRSSETTRNHQKVDRDRRPLIFPCPSRATTLLCCYTSSHPHSNARNVM